MKLLLNLLGILVVLGFMFLISVNRKAINFKNIAIALFA